MDDLLRGILLWIYISTSVMIGLGLLWIASVSTFWIFPEFSEAVLSGQPPNGLDLAGVGLRLTIWSIVSACWTFISILGWRRLVGDVERWLKTNKVDY